MMDIIGLYVLYFSFWVHDFYLSEFSLPKFDYDLTDIKI